MNYIVVMKSGAKFKVQINDFDSFIEKLEHGLSPNAKFHLYRGENVVLQIEDVSAVYPEGSEYKVQDMSR